MAYDEKISTVQVPHNMVLENRRKLSLTGVTDVQSFNEEEIIMSAGKWAAVIRGSEMHMEKLSVDSGDVIITGRIDSIDYEDTAPAGEGFFSRLFR